jgi:hypothetical protein
MKALRKCKRQLRKVFDAAVTPFQVGCDPRSRRYQKLEATVPRYTLPDPLLMSNGNRVQDAETWRDSRRPELLNAFRTHVYGSTPQAPAKTPFRIMASDTNALGGLATRKEVRVSLAGTLDGPTFTLLIYLPNRLTLGKTRAPLFLGLNFYGNHTIHKDRDISVTNSWIPSNSDTEGRPAELLRGLQASSWPVEYILNRGYGLATAYYGDIVPDRNDGLDLGIHRYFREQNPGNSAADSWGAIAGWAWGLSRAMDYLEQDEDVDARKTAAVGHSRLGKTALWAGAQDERFALVISNNSGCGGASLSKRKFGETVAMINSSFPHWFCQNFKNYNDNEDALPVDQHELIALIAPRPVYIASAQLDLEADPMGEFLAAKYAHSVYRLLGTAGLPVEELPPAGRPVLAQIGYHIRKGHHAITFFDWTQFINFADKHFQRSMA